MAGKDTAPGIQYVFDIGKLEPGDILLTSIPMSLHDSSTWNSHLIQALTRSPFSSAALYLSDGLCIEAVGSGVARLPLAKAGIRDVRNVRVLRLRKGNEWAARKAAVCGTNYLQRGFCRAGAPQTKCSAFHDVRKAAVLCSGLIANAYADADFPLLGTRLPYGIFPGDFMQSALLEDVTHKVVLPLTIPVQSTFQVDDNTVFERVHHWEIATQLKAVCNYEVRRVLDIKASKPSSMRELELLIARNRWSALDEAVSRSLKWYRFSEVYWLKQQSFLGDITAAMSGITRLLPTALDENRLARAAKAIAVDLSLLEAERAHWLEQRDYYSNELVQRYEGKTFVYMLDLYNKLLAASEQWLQSKRQQEHAYSNEAQARGLRLRTA